MDDNEVVPLFEGASEPEITPDISTIVTPVEDLVEVKATAMRIDILWHINFK
jgi:hypothetical protein